MPDLSSRSIKRIADVVRQVEGDSQFPSMMQDVRGGGYSPELRAVRITSVTLDSDGLYPAQLLDADTSANPSAWTDTTECRVQALSGDLAVGRLWAARVGETAAGLPIFSPAGGNSTSTKRYVRAATTANITLSGTQTIDGVSVAVGEDVLVKDQSTTANNGIYTAASSTWARRADADSWDELVGALVVVTEGTTLADTLWMCTSNAGGTLGSTAVSWSRIASASGLYSIDVREASGSPAYGFVSELQFDGTTATGPFELTEPSGGKALVSLKDAADGQRGVVTSGAQTFRGPKSFIERTNFYLDTDNYQIELWAGALNLGSIRSTGTSTNGETRVRTSLNDDDGYNMFYTAWLNSGAPQFMLSLDGFGTGITPAFVIRDSDNNEFIGQTTTVSGLVFKGGILTGGTFSVTVSAGDVTGLDEAIDDRVAALLVAGTGIGLSYDDGAGTLTISCTITQYTDEMARDAIGTALTAGTGIVITPNDGADTITVALSFLGLEALTDPGADRILFWDDSAGAFTWLTLGSGLSISTTTLTATGSITGPGSSTDNAIVRWNGTGGAAIQDSAVIINDDGTVEVNATTAETINTAEILHLHMLSAGTPGANFGAIVTVHLKSTTTDDVRASAQTTTWVDATHASYKSRWVLSTADAAGGREIMRGEASGSAPMIGFLGANAAIRQTGDVGTAMVTFGLMSGTPTFAWGNLSGTKSIAWSELTSVPLSLAGNVIVLQDQKSTGTSGGTFSAGTRTRVLNTEVTDTGSDCSLASNQFTLTAGTYDILAFCPCYAVDRNQAWLQNATAGTTLVLGSSGLAYSAASAQVQHHSIIAGRFTVAASQALEIQHYGQTTSNTYGFGVESSSGKTEVYTTVFLRRVA